MKFLDIYVILTIYKQPKLQNKILKYNRTQVKNIKNTQNIILISIIDASFYIIICKFERNFVILYYFVRMSGLYEQLCNMFIKPARQSYSQHDLGSVVVATGGTRSNFSFPSHKGFEIKASFFNNNNKNSEICVIYLHSFNGSRLQSLRYASEIIQIGFHFCSFDFAGCGNSGGEYVTLGCNQRWDVFKLIQNLHSKYGLTNYFIWGRSMGAVTAIKFYSLLTKEQKRGLYSNINILGMILDSAFISLRRMVAEVGSRKSSMPQFLIKAVFLMVSSSIEQRAGFNIDDLDLDADIECIKCSTLLIASNQDTFVSLAHSQDIFTKLKLHQNKEILYTKGEHYQQRDRATLNQIYLFFEKNYKKHIQNLNSMKHNASHQHSIQKSNRSLKRYEPKVTNSPKGNNNTFAYQSQKLNGARIQYRSKKQQKTPQFRTDKKIQSKQSQSFQRNYQTQKRISDFRPQIIFVTSSQVRNNDEIKNSAKPTVLKSKKQEKLSDSENIQKGIQITQTKGLHQESHCNVIADRLRKHGKYHKHKMIQFKNNISHQAISIHLQSQQKSSARTKVHINICNPSNSINQMSPEKEGKRLSMTAQQYKNIQIKKGYIALSPHGRHRQQPIHASEIKIRAQNLKQNQAKSMTNLFTINQHQHKESQKTINNIKSTAQSYIIKK